MNVKRVLLALAVLAACYALMTPTAARANPDKPADAEFAAMDANHNGRISAAEHAAAAARMFKTMDTDRDGQLSRAELRAARAQLTRTPGKG
jgi:Ca2+-binding EF-hand superfamily protein